MWSVLKKFFIFLLIGLFFNFSQLYAQEAPAEAAPAPPLRPPVMKSVFWNTTLGSAWGAIIGTMGALSSPDVPFRDSLILGTTFGGMLGYGFGVFLVIRGISFDPATIPTPPTTPLGMTPMIPANPVALDYIQPFSAESRQLAKSTAKGWQTTIFQTTF